MKQRFLNILVALDSALYVLLTLGAGYPAETFSSAAWRAEITNKPFKYARPVIDFLLRWLEKDHCRLAYEYAVRKRNLPADMR